MSIAQRPPLDSGLNKMGIKTSRGRTWTAGTLHRFLAAWPSDEKLKTVNKQESPAIADGAYSE